MIKNVFCFTIVFQQRRQRYYRTCVERNRFKIQISKNFYNHRIEKIYRNDRR